MLKTDHPEPTIEKPVLIGMQAEEVILDRRLLVLDENAFDSFEQALESNPVRGNRCLQKLLARPNRWR